MYAGIHIGIFNIKGVIIDKSGKLLSFKTVNTPENIKEINKSVADLIEVLATSASISKIDVEAIGIGTAGSIDKKKGVIISSPNISSLKDYPLAKEVEKLTGARVFLENDATVAMVGAWWKGNGSKFKNWIILTIGNGIGGGVVIDKKIYTGSNGNAMEVGHISIDHKGKECACGNYGCFERYASAQAMVELAEQLLQVKKNHKSSIYKRVQDGEVLNAKIIHEEALKKDTLAVKIIEEIAEFIGIGVANLVNIFSPEAIIFAGGLSEAHKMILPIVQKKVQERAMPGLKENVKLLPIKDHVQIPALGAAKIAIDSMNEKK